MTRGRFVVVEGGDGSGKSTQVARLVESLRARGLGVVATFEPGATPAGAVLRDVLLHGAAPIAPVTEALLMAADRAQHVAEVVAPALARGDWVVSDRFVASSLVYQGVVRGLGVDAIRALNEPAVAGVAPDLVVVLDVAEAVARGRRYGTPDRMESEATEFHESVARAYRDLARAEGWTIVDGGADTETVATQVLDAVAGLLEDSPR
ncbi:MAG TPA: dTMP kinase [Acidimicrobiia bacterium]|nr:dTMP kinase [Acidimicrobiia bacterium]